MFSSDLFDVPLPPPSSLMGLSAALVPAAFSSFGLVASLPTSQPWSPSTPTSPPSQLMQPQVPATPVPVLPPDASRSLSVSSSSTAQTAYLPPSLPLLAHPVRLSESTLSAPRPLQGGRMAPIISLGSSSADIDIAVSQLGEEGPARPRPASIGVVAMAMTPTPSSPSPKALALLPSSSCLVNVDMDLDQATPTEHPARKLREVVEQSAMSITTPPRIVSPMAARTGSATAAAAPSHFKFPTEAGQPPSNRRSSHASIDLADVELSSSSTPLAHSPQAGPIRSSMQWGTLSTPSLGQSISDVAPQRPVGRAAAASYGRLEVDSSCTTRCQPSTRSLPQTRTSSQPADMQRNQPATARLPSRQGQPQQQAQAPGSPRQPRSSLSTGKLPPSSAGKLPSSSGRLSSSTGNLASSSSSTPSAPTSSARLASRQEEREKRSKSWLLPSAPFSVPSLRSRGRSTPGPARPAWGAGDGGARRSKPTS
mmetsp:Transcript_52243/g.113835  ORF Transcript_52243/g.113835 Transcript_52243/m.113835 type:complete len:481 (-) Transcript_52243:183-1625(-)